MKLTNLCILALILVTACQRSPKSGNNKWASRRNMSEREKAEEKSPEDWVKALEDKSERERSVKYLLELGQDAVPALIQGLSNADSDIRLHSARTLKKMGRKADDSVPTLVKAMKGDSDSDVRFACVSALGAMGPEAKAKADDIIKCLKTDSDESVRFVSAEVLSKLGVQNSQLSSEVLKLLLKSNSQVHTSVVLETIGRMGESMAPLLLEELKAQELKKQDSKKLRRLIQALAAIGPKAEKAMPLLLKLKAHKSREVRTETIKCFGSIGPKAKDAISFLIENLGPGDYEPKLVCQALANIGPAAIDPILEKLNSSDQFEQKFAAAALSLMGPKAAPAIPKLMKVLRTPSTPDYVRHSISIALAKAGPSSARPLAGLLSNKDPKLRVVAAETLELMAIDAKGASSALKRATKDSDPQVQSLARQALEKIELGMSPQ